MPIGKNAINRVKNNGYSNVETSAPDMENSVIANPDSQVVEKMVKPVEEKTAKKAPAKKTAAKTPAKKAEAPTAETPAKKAPAKKPAAKKAPANEGFKRVEVGNEMPYYLL
jgi:trigger factor